MRFSFDDAEKEAAVEFGSLEIPDGDKAITVLTPLWLDDEATVERIAERQRTIAGYNDLDESEQLTHLAEMKGELIELLVECSDQKERLREQLRARPLPVVLSLFRKWQEAAQPGEASRSSS